MDHIPLNKYLVKIIKDYNDCSIKTINKMLESNNNKSITMNIELLMS